MVALHLADVSDALVRLLKTGDLTPPEPPRADHPDPVTAAHEGLAELDQALLLAADAATDSAAKGYVLNLGEALHHELARDGVYVTVLLPAP